MPYVAGVQPERVFLALGVVAVDDDLAVVVDRGRVVEREAGARRDQVVEVLQRPTAVDHGSADNHAIVVDGVREEVGAQVGHRPVAPQVAELGRCAGLGIADHLPEIVDVRRVAGLRAQVGGRPVLPKHPVGVAAGVITGADHFAALVDRAAPAAASCI